MTAGQLGAAQKQNDKLCPIVSGRRLAVGIQIGQLEGRDLHARPGLCGWYRVTGISTAAIYKSFHTVCEIRDYCYYLCFVKALIL